ncbi:uncharacterized protein LOC120634099 [Pararge aegeria]|uniref:uncharacterized protein LOC120634099 n=1 Tax=Pararge aegeria TaxID=116150 RepID=UPI0019D1674B|nr:uncharacterized protein LOC120634099 [Pararge aegeria]
MYAIAGTDMYIKSHQLTENRCTQAWRRKVVYTCVPAAYDLQYSQLAKWSHDDIAVLKVEKPFLFEGRAWRECKYKPAIIPINFDLEYEQPGTDAIVLGWGHTMEWRSPNSTVDLNQKKLQYTSVSILDREECKKHFTNTDMGKQIDDYMICTYHDGKLDDSGKIITSRKYYHRRKSNTTVPWERRRSSSRRNGICQNDHGGPLVTWINGTEHVIGIASVFRVDQHSQCIGPFLYTSTARNKEFVNCILKDLIHTDDIERRRSVCDQPEGAKSLVILRRYIKWTENTRGSLSSNLNIRPQIPISQYTGK